MSTRAIDALHDVHTATNDVLKGYREMAARAEPEIQTVIHRLTDMHERHAAEQSIELARRRDAGKDDSSLQGSVNQVVVVLRDWISRVDRDALPAVREGDESLRDEYDKALRNEQVSGHPSIAALLSVLARTFRRDDGRNRRRLRMHRPADGRDRPRHSWTGQRGCAGS